jgi:hypothetical protein
MTLRPGARKIVLGVHIAVSVGWIGAVAAYLALDLAAARTEDVALVRAAYTAMSVIAVRVIVPLAVGALVTGIAVSLGTKWGLLRHYWVVISLLLTLLATGVLLVETRTIAELARRAADPAAGLEAVRVAGGTLVHSIGGLAVLLMILVLNIAKPQGLTRYGWRRQQARP